MSHYLTPMGSGLALFTKNIDGKVVATTSLGKTIARGLFIPTGVYIRVASVSALVAACTLSVGSNAGANDIVPATALTGLSTVDKVMSVAVSTLATGVQPVTTVNVNVTIGATATTFLFDCWLLGFYTQ